MEDESSSAISAMRTAPKNRGKKTTPLHELGGQSRKLRTLPIRVRVIPINTLLLKTQGGIETGVKKRKKREGPGKRAERGWG